MDCLKRDGIKYKVLEKNCNVGVTSKRGAGRGYMTNENQHNSYTSNIGYFGRLKSDDMCEM
jgi:hypothetical protein